MATDMSLGGFLLTREEWEGLDDDERLLLLGAVVGPSSGQVPDKVNDGVPDGVPGNVIDVPDSYYESYEIIYAEKLAS